jgi:hypothetical protein
VWRCKSLRWLMPILVLGACAKGGSVPPLSPPVSDGDASGPREAGSGGGAERGSEVGSEGGILGVPDAPELVSANDGGQDASAQRPEISPIELSADGSLVAEAGSAVDAALVDATQPPVCARPTPIDAGRAACGVGRYHLDCLYPAGVACDDGTTFTGTGGARMLCVSDEPTGCSGCHPISGTATCESKCAPDQFVMACGGPPVLALDGGDYDRGYYQAPPAQCTLTTPTPSGVGYYCCPCQ